MMEINRQIKAKLHSKNGVSIVLLVLLIAVAVMLVVVMVPSALGFTEDAGNTGCTIALNSAQKKINESTVLNMGNLSTEEVMRAATQSVTDFNDLCPSGGEIYLEPNAEGGYTIVCGLHDSDTLRRTRLNAQRVLERLQAMAEKAELRGLDFPNLVSVPLNSESLVAEQVEEETGLKRGTASTHGYTGTVVYYMTDHNEISYLSFADENHAATWRKGEGWVYDSP